MKPIPRQVFLYLWLLCFFSCHFVPLQLESFSGRSVLFAPLLRRGWIGGHRVSADSLVAFKGNVVRFLLPCQMALVHYYNMQRRRNMCLIYSGKQHCLICFFLDDRVAHVGVRHDWLNKYDHENSHSPSWMLDSWSVPFLFVLLLVLTSLLLFFPPLLLLFTFIVCVCLGAAHVLCLRMLDLSISVHSWGTSGFSIIRCHIRSSSPCESIQSTSFP